MPRQLNIIARKPRDEFNEHVVIDRGPAYDHPHDLRYVSATSNRICAARGEWFWGNYFRTKAEAIAHFDARVSAPIDTSRSNIVVVEGGKFGSHLPDCDCPDCHAKRLAE